MARKSGTTVDTTPDTDTNEEHIVTDTNPTQLDPDPADVPEGDVPSDPELDAHVDESGDAPDSDEDEDEELANLEALLEPVHAEPKTRAQKRLAIAESVARIARVQTMQEQSRAAVEANRAEQEVIREQLVSLRAKAAELREKGAELRASEASLRDQVATARAATKALRDSLRIEV